jgi:hypothetical protein
MRGRGSGAGRHLHLRRGGPVPRGAPIYIEVYLGSGDGPGYIVKPKFRIGIPMGMYFMNSQDFSWNGQRKEMSP